MKLIHYTLRNLWIPLFTIFAIWGSIFYGMILHEVEDETNDSLVNYKEIIIRSVLADSTLLKDHVDIMTRYYIREVPKEKARLDNDIFYDSNVYIELEGEYEPVRVLHTYFMTADHVYYELKIETSTLEKEDMIETIVGSMAILYLLLIGCILMVFHRAFHKSFAPLYKLLSWLKQFHVGKEYIPLNNPTRINEFVILNKEIEESSLRSIELYKKQKQFVENASHELQTPLAVCMNKLELLSEDSNCTEKQLEAISGLHQTLHNIIRLNKSLLLLSRIENKQFPDSSEIYFNQLIKDQLEDICGLYEHKSIHLYINDCEQLVYTMNRSLATTLTLNLIKNAFVHNRQNGDIHIRITRHSLTVANTGTAKELDSTHMFDRFSRQTTEKNSTGLGLAIVKSISDLYNLQITYSYENERHQFKLTFH